MTYTLIQCQVKVDLMQAYYFYDKLITSGDHKYAFC